MLKNYKGVLKCDNNYFLKYFFVKKYIKIIFYYYFLNFICNISTSK